MSSANVMFLVGRYRDSGRRRGQRGTSGSGLGEVGRAQDKIPERTNSYWYVELERTLTSRRRAALPLLAAWEQRHGSCPVLKLWLHIDDLNDPNNDEHDDD